MQRVHARTDTHAARDNCSCTPKDYHAVRTHARHARFNPSSYLISDRRYANHPDAAVLTQYFPNGIEPQNQDGALDEIVSAFPSFAALQSTNDFGIIA